MSTDGLAAVQRFGRALRGRDWAEVRRLLHPEVTVRTAGGLPYSGDYHGADGFIELFATMTDLLRLEPGPLLQQTLDDRTVVSRFRLRFTAHADGRSVEMDLVEIYRLADGLIVEVDVYYKDPSAVAALLTR